MSFVKNAWYVAALSNELGSEALFSRVLLGEPVLFYRDDKGVPVAMTDRCPHRFAPLHLGKRTGNSVSCPYHGLTFDQTGKCILSPHGDGAIPPRAKLRVFTAIERYQLIWIWMGDPQYADAALIPDYSFVQLGPKDACFSGYLHNQSNYQLLIDNILDLSHADFLHPTLLASGSAVTSQRPVVKDQRRGFRVSWEWRNTPPMEVFAVGMAPGQRDTDGWLWVDWEPVGSMLLHSGATPAGKPRSEGVSLTALHCMTPESEKTSHYFYVARRDYLTDEATNNIFAELTRKAFSTEDKPIIEAVQRYMGDADLWSLKPAVLTSDVAGIKARQAIDAMLHNEAAAGG